MSNFLNTRQQEDLASGNSSEIYLSRSLKKPKVANTFGSGPKPQPVGLYTSVKKGLDQGYLSVLPIRDNWIFGGKIYPREFRSDGYGIGMWAQDADDPSIVNRLTLSNQGALYVDGTDTPRGIVYNDDYSDSFGIRSLVDRGFVEALWVFANPIGNDTVKYQGQMAIDILTDKVYIGKSKGTTDWILLN